MDPLNFIKGGLTSIAKEIKRAKNNNWWVWGLCIDRNLCGTEQVKHRFN
jgi:hypothetical protein